MTDPIRFAWEILGYEYEGGPYCIWCLTDEQIRRSQVLPESLGRVCTECEDRLYD